MYVCIGVPEHLDLSASEPYLFPPHLSSDLQCSVGFAHTCLSASEVQLSVSNSDEYFMPLGPVSK